MRCFRHKATKKEWQAIADAKAGLCRGCGRRSDSLHHLVPRSLGGDDVADNIIPLCGHGTIGCHGAIENHTGFWRAIAHNIRASLTDAELEYATSKKSQFWLDRYLPAERVA